MPTQKAKEPLLAVLLTCQLPGLGQVYAGRFRRGFFLFILPTLVNVLLLGYVLLPQTQTHMLLLAFVPLVFAYLVYIMVDAHRCASQWNEVHQIKRKIVFPQKALLIMSIIVSILGINGGAFFSKFVFRKRIQAFKLPSGTMMPTLSKRDRVLADKALYKKQKPQRGDVIVFVYPFDGKRVFLKRLIAFGGETVEIRDGDIYVNGQRVVEERIKKQHYFNNGQYAQEGQTVSVPEEQLYVLGDNSAKSSDSRFWGFVPAQNVIGKVYKIYWPPERSGPVD